MVKAISSARCYVYVYAYLLSLSLKFHYVKISMISKIVVIFILRVRGIHVSLAIYRALVVGNNH
jgi:hypothetical protein